MSKRSRDVPSSALANDIRSTVGETSQYEIESRTKYIKDQLDNMSEEQLTRFEFFVRSHLPRNKVKDILSNTLGAKYNVTDDIAIVVSGLAKLFIGEITEIAFDVMKEEGKTTGITPEHIEEAFRRLQRDGKIGKPADKAYMFSSQSMVVGDAVDSELFDNPDGLDELICTPTGTRESAQHAPQEDL